MKRIFTFGLMLASVFALTNCTEELVDPTIPNDEVTQETTTPEGEGIPFQIYASLGTETKTVGSASADGTLKTAWESGDQINVFHKVSDAAAYVDDGLFTVADIKNGLFDGKLQEELDPNKLYNWYFVYVEDQSGKATDLKKEQLTAIPMTFNVEPKEISQVSGVNCPMYGTIKNLSGAVTPRMQLKHMTSLIELTIVNNTAAKDYHKYWKWTGGAITLTDVKMSSSSALTNSSLTANITGNEIAFTQPGSAQTELVALSNGNVSVPNTGANTKTFYFVVAPSTFKPHEITFMINGDSRTLKKSLAFEAGKVTRFTIPINHLRHPHISDAALLKSTGACTNNKWIFDMFSTIENNGTDTHVSVNGQSNVPLYVVGGNGKSRDMILRGSTKDIINALDAGFYASTWKGMRAAMTISNIQLYIDGYQLSEYQPFLAGLKAALLPSIKKVTMGNEEWAEQAWEEGIDLWITKIPPLKDWVVDMFKAGIPRDGTLLYLGKFIDYQTITFNGVVECGTSTDHNNIIVLNEENIYKGINKDLIDMFLNDETKPMGGKFVYNDYKPTYQGLYDLINYDQTIEIKTDDDVKTKIDSDADTVTGNQLTYAYNTAYAIYNKLLEKIGDKEFSLAGIFNVQFRTVFDSLFGSLPDMVTKLPNIEVEITISTCDYKPNKADYSGVSLKDMQATNNPIIFWGLDAYGHETE